MNCHILKQVKNILKMTSNIRNILEGSNAFSPLLNQLQRRIMASDQFTDNPEDRIVWVDMEMTGLDIEKHRILEVACIITDAQLNTIAEAPEMVLYQPKPILDLMDTWCVTQHNKSGLIKKVMESKMSEEQVEQTLLDFVTKYIPHKKCPLAGNSVTFDRFFMLKYFPKFEQHLHYRVIDVSSVKELCKRWFPEEFDKVMAKKGESKHRAMDDIQNSIMELQYYRKTIFRHHEGVESMAISWC